MKRNNILSLFTIGILVAACNESEQSIPILSDTGCAADLILHNTTLYSANEEQWIAEAVASSNGKIIFVGGNSDAEQYMCSTTEALDLSGKFVYAGFTDSHQHLEGVGG